MNADRRTFIKLGLAAPIGMNLAMALPRGNETSQVPSHAGPAATTIGKVPYKRIATEEAWGPQEMFDQYRRLLGNGGGGSGLKAQFPNLQPGRASSDPHSNILLDRLTDIGEGRLKDMDAAGIDMQILSLTSPGVQVFDAATANSLAASSNDQLAEAIRRYPNRFAGLAAVAPQDPKAAAKEMERGIKKLGLKGVIINSHTQGEYLDDTKFWEIFEAAEALDAAIYLHPQTPSPEMIQPYLVRGFERAFLGFQAEVALHTLAIISSGAFDRFPKLKIVIGHGGEALPYMLYRIDYFYTRGATVRHKQTKGKPSDYMKSNIFITTSGMPWAPAITMAQSVLGMDRVLYAMDYPYEYVVEEVAMTDNFPISDDDKKRLFQTNAERVFGL
jgi:5-carboxyvanillate decarboxylase